MSFLKLSEVSYSYPNGFEATQKVSMEFQLGEAVAIIGQNGAGKTTTVKLMNGLLRPTKGEVLIDGKSTNVFTAAQMSKHVGYVFQNPDDQIFQETIEKEIAFGPKSQKLAVSVIKKKVKEAAETCGLTEVLNEHPYNLSYSKRKFITIAAIIAMDPEVIVLDEPTAGQDRESTELLGRIIKELSAKNKAVITITHDMEFVVKEFQRVLVFADKQLRKEGTPREVFWDESLLTLSGLKQPYICQLAKALGFKNILTMEELGKKVLGHEKNSD
ncbi:energy-coupling factor ABC transporter ATP-binding protein [Enterococcus sp. BWT-B8]|uniref:energy-coupling factor ABC transporter ATP-binding protein n=1 Tax=Enterococcus sp. BWT-B8 TaxID=2885157 RepID=UPI001E3DA06F|nr:ABC transporter ATP-binding protein [Enterococcus sp. BWT-B8]MCB5952009.1 energy-coupling factor ABC transporter ATP-binding protein [Enterococcus sp. BWT-B8]